MAQSTFTLNNITFTTKTDKNGKAFFTADGKRIGAKAFEEAAAEYEEAAKAAEESEAKAAEKAAKKAERQAKMDNAIQAIEEQVVAAFNKFTEYVTGLSEDNSTKDKREANRPHTFMSFQYNGKPLFEVCWSSKGVRVVAKSKLMGEKAPAEAKVINNGSLDLYIPTFTDRIEERIYEYAIISAGLDEAEAVEEAKVEEA